MFNSLETYSKYKEDKKILKEIEKSKEAYRKRQEFYAREKEKYLEKQQLLIDEKIRRRLQRDESKINVNFEKKVRKIQWKKPLKKYEKKISTSKLKKELFSLVQLLARLEEVDHTWMWNCISCWKRVNRREADGWHYISRIHMSTAFDLRNIHLQCKYCNEHLHWNLIEYRKNLIKKYWLEFVEDLERRKHEIKNYTVEELQDLINKTKLIVEEERKKVI